MSQCTLILSWLPQKHTIRRLIAKCIGNKQPWIDYMHLTIVVPLFNEEENVERLYSSIVDAVSPEDFAFEILFVNDGSSDRTAEIAAGLAVNDSRLRVVEFRKNYGQTAAMAAGIDVAQVE
jgi:glycosyltransferase involved in cell wall biosynthesis